MVFIFVTFNSFYLILHHTNSYLAFLTLFPSTTSVYYIFSIYFFALKNSIFHFFIFYSESKLFFGGPLGCTVDCSTQAGVTRQCDKPNLLDYSGSWGALPKNYFSLLNYFYSYFLTLIFSSFSTFYIFNLEYSH